MQVSLVLKAKGMVERPRSLTDPRAKRIEVTVAAVATLHWTTPLAIAVLERLLGTAGKPGGALLTALVADRSGRAELRLR